MAKLLRALWVLLAVSCPVALGACRALVVDQTTRCAELNARIASCFGGDLKPVTCGAISDNSLTWLNRGLSDNNCELIRDFFPIDGDFRGASCRNRSEGCKAPINPIAAGTATRFPIILVNGIDTSPLFRYSDRILSVLREDGHQRVYLGTLPAYQGPSKRSAVLWEIIESVRRETGAEKVNLICHSLGGLDCRYVVADRGLAADLLLPPETIQNRVASITTVATAHRGTKVADIALGFVPDATNDDRTNAIAAFLGNWFGKRAVVDEAALRDALASLSETESAAFNQRITDVPSIYYQSYAGVSRPFGETTINHTWWMKEHCRVSDTDDGLGLMTPDLDFMAMPLIASAQLLDEYASDDGSVDVAPSDGLCPARSAHWGVFRGCIPADHMEQLGQRNIADANTRTGFDIASFYNNVASDLAARGF